MADGSPLSQNEAKAHKAGKFDVMAENKKSPLLFEVLGGTMLYDQRLMSRIGPILQPSGVVDTEKYLSMVLLKQVKLEMVG